LEEKHWVEEIFERCGAIRRGHFKLTSGRHTGKYLDKAMVLPYVPECRDICREMAENAGMHHIDADAVVGPASGGIILSHNVAHYLEDFADRPVLALFTEKDNNGRQVLRKRYKELLAGKRVLIVDDNLTTGGSIRQVAKEVEDAGATVAAVVIICNRGGVTSEDIGGYPLLALWNIDIESWEPGPDTCPLCAAGVPLEDPKFR